MTGLETLAEFVTELDFDQIPGDVVAKATDVVTNVVGVQLAASGLPWSQMVREVMLSQGGKPQSTIVRSGERTSATTAAFVNGAFAHGFELDDNHPRTSLKAGSVVMPAAFAVAEERPCSGRELLTAVIAGFEVMTHVALMARPGLGARAHHPSGTCGAVGAAAASARILGLDRDRTTYALGAGIAQLAGYTEVPVDGRGTLKRTYAGTAAASGVRCALLAEAGLTTPRTSLDAGSGFCRSFGVDESRASLLCKDLGTEWEILTTQIKIYSTDGYIQPMLEAIAHIRAAHPFETQDVARVWVGTSRHACDDVVGRNRDPRTITDAQFSANFCVALYLSTGGAGYSEFTEKNLGAARILELSQRVAVEVDDEVEQEYQVRRPRGAKVRIELASGEEYTEYVPELRMMTSAEVDAKFRSLARTALSPERTEELLGALRSIAQANDVSHLAPLMVA